MDIEFNIPKDAADKQSGMRDKNDMIRCVFSTAGTGDREYWFVNQAGEDRYILHQINKHNVPVEAKEKIITTDDLLAGYVPEVEFYEQTVIPAVAKLEGHLTTGENERDEGKLYSAEHSFEKALVMDENNARALFNLGLIYLEWGDQGKAVKIMDALLDLQATFKGKNQHLFNQFGIALRKASLLDEAASYFAKALEFVTTDEHLYYNYARINYERGNWEACVQGLAKAWIINPKLEVIIKLVTLVKALAADDRLCEKYGKPPISPELAERIRELLKTTPADDGDLDVADVPDLDDESVDLDEGAIGPERGRARSGKDDDITSESFDLD